MNAEEVFLDAVDIADETHRLAFVARACEKSPALREQVELLLRSHSEAEHFLEQPLVDPPLSAVSAIVFGDHQSGECIGPYRLIEVIGRGGMGIVYIAQQEEPVRRRVAIKVIKPGVCSESIAARFEVERQALALMDHPNIARVFDAGSTTAGQLYFVMELINGVSITQYCDRARMTARQRLELMIPICEAVQHAHQKGIIHRDLKPSNVLVTEYDGRPVPKVIDFGVAKALAGSVDETSNHTRMGQVIGTLEYMSPEQAEMNQLDVDTRSDIYALGVLMYELLTGTTPLEKHRIDNAGFMEVLRIIREEEFAKPSTRISNVEGVAEAAANRSTDPSRLTGIVRGELDWIVMKALEKDRNRRYGSAASVARDIQHYLRDEPIEARPASVLYRVRKFARRKRSTLVPGSCLAVLVGVIALGGWLYRAASLETDRERAASAQARAQKEALERLADIEKAIHARRFEDAVEMLQEIEHLIPEHPELPALWAQCSVIYSIRSSPAGVDIWRRSYDTPKAPWKRVITTSDATTDVRVPRGEFLWRASKAGYRDEIGLRAAADATFELEGSETVTNGMIRVTAGRPERPSMAFSQTFESVDLPAFLIDRCEVTNEEYEHFVKAGGYERDDLWQALPFSRGDGVEISWEEVKPLLVDQTGHPGPSTWRNGTFGTGEERHPVDGVCWYEAMAYARFVGKSLPTIYHWVQASQVELSVALAGDAFITKSGYGDTVQSVDALSDFNYFGLSGVMGNVREWCINSNGIGNRFVLGGACDDPIYVPLTLYHSPPLRRDRHYGFRCVKYATDQPEPVTTRSSSLQIRWPKPPERYDLFDDEMFRLVVADRFRYDPEAPLDVTIETNDELEWLHVTAEINTAYRDSLGDWERMSLHIYLPKGPVPRNGFQTVVYSPSRDSWMLPHMRSLEHEYSLDRLVRSGRAVVRPVLVGSYERRLDALPRGLSDWEELRRRLGLDIMRTIDYLQQRADIDSNKLCYYGFSFGAEWVGSLVSVEPRIKAAVFEAGGLGNAPLREEAKFLEWRECLPHIRVPVLMINGEDDTIYPVVESQKPMFDLLGSSEKEHYVYPGGHHMLPPDVRFEKITDWLDQRFGSPRL